MEKGYSIEQIHKVSSWLFNHKNIFVKNTNVDIFNYCVIALHLQLIQITNNESSILEEKDINNDDINRQLSFYFKEFLFFNKIIILSGTTFCLSLFLIGLFSDKSLFNYLFFILSIVSALFFQSIYKKYLTSLPFFLLNSFNNK